MSTAQLSKIEQLEIFKRRDKFSNEAWDERGLNSSSTEICENLALLFDQTSDELSLALQQGYEGRRLKKVLVGCLKMFKAADYDTEEREFICDLFFELSVIVGVDISKEVMNWLYGKVFATLMRLIPSRRVTWVRFSQDCSKCGVLLETKVEKSKQPISNSYWFIIQCNSCKSFELLTDIGENNRQIQFGNYKAIENYDKAEYSSEQISIRLEQLPVFRNN